jgi:hypothetical protein
MPSKKDAVPVTMVPPRRGCCVSPRGNEGASRVRLQQIVCFGPDVVRWEMRFLATAVVISTVSFTTAVARASGLEDSRTALSALEAKADQAQPRDRCFLYAELVSQMTEVASQQFNSGDSVQASETLKLVQRYAEKVHTDVADDSKRLKNAEVLMQRTCFRLKGILSAASYEDRQGLEATLKQLNQVQAELMMHVFRK